MKIKESYYVWFFVLVILFSSCRVNKKVTSTYTPSDTTIKSVSDKPVNKPKAKIVATKKTPVENTVWVEHTNSPSVEMQKVFRKDYPKAVKVTWTKETPISDSNTSTDYRVNFQLNKISNSLVYSDSCEVIETRVHILPEQLPPAVYRAIRNKYGDVRIVSATTYKRVRELGSYAVFVRLSPRIKDKQLIITESGEFIQ